MIYGAIDIGTNAARLLVGQVVKENGHSFVKKISYTRIPLRLGLEVFEDGMISPQKTEEFSKTIEAFKLLAEVFHVRQLRACATSAMREAENGLAVRQAVFERTGVEIDIIDGDEEARLIFGTFFLLDFDKSLPFLVIDVGGGSTEISVFENGVRVGAKSFKLGTIRLLKKKESKDIWPEVHDWIAEHVDPKMVHKVFATGGNINKVHKLLGKQFMDTIKFRELDELHDKLSKLSVEERMTRYQLKEDRADVIVPACEIYKYVMKELKAKELIVPKIGLSDGIIYDLHLQAE
jgi:exopolyphosphatase / guanosine-5'-triphosphate,3'-diphosphate pyrophosphatase